MSSVSIRDISAPAAVEAGKELLLDCDFTYNKEEVEEVVVKWFHNNSTTPFYQWVPALDIGPQVGEWILLSLLQCHLSPLSLISFKMTASCLLPFR